MVKTASGHLVCQHWLRTEAMQVSTFLSFHPWEKNNSKNPYTVLFWVSNSILTHFLGACTHIYNYFQSQNCESGHGHSGNTAPRLGLVATWF